MVLEKFTGIFDPEQEKILQYARIALSILYLQGEENLGKVRKQTSNLLKDTYRQIFGEEKNKPK